MVIEERRGESRASARGNGLRACVSEAKKPSNFRNALCSSFPGFSRSLSLYAGCLHKRTLELIAPEVECAQARQIADRLGNRACTPRERATGTIRERSPFPSSRSPVLSSLPCVAWNQHGSGIEARTRERIALEHELLQARQIPDRLGNCACTPRKRATGTIRERSSFPSSRSPFLSSLSPV